MVLISSMRTYFDTLNSSIWALLLEIYKINFIDRRRDFIPNVIIPWSFGHKNLSNGEENDQSVHHYYHNYIKDQYNLELMSKFVSFEMTEDKPQSYKIFNTMVIVNIKDMRILKLVYVKVPLRAWSKNYEF